ncbi:MAG TPA: DNA repair protein RadA, partial [Alphaproteobacteria bacterium]|nr:DNA repair protein RadA [Alphaproteobacteria bacterium]
MARGKSSFVCQACGAVYSRWQGRCESCGEWNSVAEEILESGIGAGPKTALAAGRPAELVPL